jgi:hypothetical protein
MANTSLQGLLQASVRAISGSSRDYNGDWAALFDFDGIAAGDWNGRLLKWINLKLRFTYTSLVSAMNDMAKGQGVPNFGLIGTIDVTFSSLLLRDNSSHFLLRDGTSRFLKGH